MLEKRTYERKSRIETYNSCAILICYGLEIVCTCALKKTQLFDFSQPCIVNCVFKHSYLIVVNHVL